MVSVTVRCRIICFGLANSIDQAIKLCPDRIWIIDHMIAAGSLKCLIVLGISSQEFARLDRPLEHHDVDVLALIPTEASTGTVVNDQLDALARQHGVPSAILTDRGSDLKKGVELFQQWHPETIPLHDIVHLVSRLIWKRLEKENRFSDYRQACCHCANKLRQSPLAHLKPPRPKTKARYMNLDSEVRWGQRALWLLDRVRGEALTDRQRQRLKRDEVELQLGWLDDYRGELAEWMEMITLGQTCCVVVRRCGYSGETLAPMRTSLGSGTTPAAQELTLEILSAVEHQCQQCEGYPHKLPGSSEVVESLIGKGKRLLGTSQNNNSLTGQILSMAASTIQLTTDKLKEILDRCRLRHVRDWLKSNIRPGIHVARQEDLTDADDGIKVAQFQMATTPNF